MNRTMSQTLTLDPTQLKSSLESLGYNLRDCGSYWRSSAIYRGGDNATALKIYKNSGVWTDFASGDKSFPIKKLISLTLNTKDDSVIDKYVKFDLQNTISNEVKEKIEMEKIYPESMLENLLPHLDFYSKKMISPDTLNFYKCGYATAGQLFRRIVFPIYDSQGQIHGFSARATVWDKDSTFPKWKHLGKKTNWVYPLHVKRGGVEIVREKIAETGTVIIVESIGDSMALFENGYANNLVTFGLGISSKLCSTLVELNPDKIIIAYNNDATSEFNHGLVSSCKSYLQLCSVFDHTKLQIKLPLANDFSDMNLLKSEGQDNIFDKWNDKAINKEAQIKKIYEIACQNDFNRFLIKKAEELKESFV